MCAQEHQLVLHPASLVLGAKQAVGFGNLLRPKPLFVADGKCHTTWKKKLSCYGHQPTSHPAANQDKPLIVASVPMNITWKADWVSHKLMKSDEKWRRGQRRKTKGDKHTCAWSQKISIVLKWKTSQWTSRPLTMPMPMTVPPLWTPPPYISHLNGESGDTVDHSSTGRAIAEAVGIIRENTVRKTKSGKEKCLTLFWPIPSISEFCGLNQPIIGPILSSLSNLPSQGRNFQEVRPLSRDTEQGRRVWDHITESHRESWNLFKEIDRQQCSNTKSIQNIPNQLFDLWTKQVPDQ